MFSTVKVKADYMGKECSLQQYGTFCRKNLDSALWAKENGKYVLQADWSHSLVPWIFIEKVDIFLHIVKNDPWKQIAKDSHRQTTLYTDMEPFSVTAGLLRFGKYASFCVFLWSINTVLKGDIFFTLPWHSGTWSLGDVDITQIFIKGTNVIFSTQIGHIDILGKSDISGVLV